MRYLDTSLLVAAFTAERRTTGVQAWLATQQAGELLISDWVTTEYSAALSVKKRIGHLTTAERNRALETFHVIAQQSFHTLAVVRNDFLVAARLADRQTEGIRAGDALHLAITLRAGATLQTLDRKLGEQAMDVGVSVGVELINGA